MLGDLIYEGGGKRIVRRILSTDPVNVEVTFEGGGKLLGVDVMEIGTYTSVIQSDGTLYGEGQGVVMSAEGDQISWKGGGAGAFQEGGAVRYRGAIYYRTASKKLSRVNNMVGVFEFGSDLSGATQSKVWEWK